MSKGVEKRKFHRLDIPLEVNIEIITEEELLKGLSPLKMKSCNISPEGICLETRNLEMDGINLLSGRPGARDNRLHLEIELIEGENPFKAVGQVCWYDISRESPDFMYQVGIEFVEIEGSGKEQLHRFLKTHKKNSGGFFQRLFS